jgi:RimJ/RimL family protein N-acetyltransferase
MKSIQGKNINLRPAEVKDAEFILELRTQTDKTQFLSQVDDNLQKQRNWLKDYKVKEQEGLEYYFIIESKLSEQIGLVRVYDLLSDSFCWGSWLIKENAPTTTAIESALLIYEFGFGELSYKKSHFDVRKGNERVIAFHKRFGAKVVSEDRLQLYFNYLLEDYLKIKQKYRRHLS